MNQLLFNRIYAKQQSLSIGWNRCINCNDLSLLEAFSSLNKNVKEMIDIIVLDRANNVNEFFGQSIDCILKLQNLLLSSRRTNDVQDGWLLLVVHISNRFLGMRAVS
jgi:hypothetical protein